MKLSKACGFTLSELLVVVAVIAVLVTLLLPSVQSFTSRMNRLTCLNNLGRIGQAYHMFRGDYTGAMPVGVWQDRLAKYTDTPIIFRCPEGGDFDQALWKSDFLNQPATPEPPKPEMPMPFYVVDDGWHAMPNTTPGRYHGDYNRFAGVEFKFETVTGGTNVTITLSPRGHSTPPHYGSWSTFYWFIDGVEQPRPPRFVPTTYFIAGRLRGLHTDGGPWTGAGGGAVHELRYWTSYDGNMWRHNDRLLYPVAGDRHSERFDWQLHPWYYTDAMSAFYLGSAPEAYPASSPGGQLDNSYYHFGVNYPWYTAHKWPEFPAPADGGGGAAEPPASTEPVEFSYGMNSRMKLSVFSTRPDGICALDYKSLVANNDDPDDPKAALEIFGDAATGLGARHATGDLLQANVLYIDGRVMSRTAVEIDPDTRPDLWGN
ncbi:MAG: prepilin-type N-terminal cleavage/methylation domain-containing protein [Planctomycetaceae bacterium]|nr:prepilin-type N-terminal cleavage/methylation domain-containing protein [Planctomycetaceae bacterium]